MPLSPCLLSYSLVKFLSRATCTRIGSVGAAGSNACEILDDNELFFCQVANHKFSAPFPARLIFSLLIVPKAAAIKQYCIVLETIEMAILWRIWRMYVTIFGQGGL
jgi:hypothetical protein